MGFREVVAGPLVRSSYQADQVADIAMARATQ
jgi:lipoic acid synthetase